METTAESKNCVLNADAISRKIRRMALEVAEQNPDEKDIIIAGINGNGEILAALLMEELKKVKGFHIHYTTIRLNKKDPVNIELDKSMDLNGKMVLLTDDVANSGRTMLFALKPLLNARPKKIQTLVLVERSHKLFPIQTDYKGLSISTTLQEHISVETEGKKITGAWLY